jgi:3-methyladenine DNA glycosylase/8-oxoguanine DNA glycosylase
VSRLRYNRRQAVAHLRSRCAELGRFIDGCGPLELRVPREFTVFEALASAIVYQQLSGKAASTIHDRFRALFAGAAPEPARAAELDFDTLRSVGLSRNKALSITDLAEKCSDGTLPSLQRLNRMDDPAVIERLCRVRGIGPWTAQMFLIFHLGRPDVMPATDLGVQKGVKAIFGMGDLPEPAEVLERTAHLSPYRSAASWYFWRAADTELLA